MDPMSHQANIAKTYENLRFWLILEGWRVTNAASGSLRKLGGALGLASGWLDGGWLAGCWLAGLGPQIQRPWPEGGKIFIRGGYYKLQTTRWMKSRRIEGRRIEGLERLQGYKATRMRGYKATC
jgi:hypothetical protein